MCSSDLDIEPLEDERGFFARSFCAEEFAAQGLTAGFVRTNIAFNQTRGTLRGLHYQAAPKPEPKLVRCTRGAIFDVAADLRPGSPTHGRWTGHELSADNRRALYVPEGCAHGLLTLEDDSEVCYLMGRSEEHTSELQSQAYLVCRLLLEKKTTAKLVSRLVMAAQ